MDKPTLTIAIPAYNEEANILYLLESCLAQEIKSADLKEIIVISDGSSDKTVELAQSLADSRIKILDNKDRRGKAHRQNELVDSIESDLLVIFDADVLPKDNYVIERMIIPLIENKNIGLTSPFMTAAPSLSFFESILEMSINFKNDLYLKMHDSNNIYMCVGGARAFSKGFYKQTHWDPHCPEDAFSYLDCITKGFKFVCIKEATVITRVPNNLKDHLKRSSRFYYGQKHLKDHFGEEIIKREYWTPKWLQIKWILYYIATHHIKMLLYIALVVYAKFFKSQKVANYSMWDISSSTKKVIIDPKNGNSN